MAPRPDAATATLLGDAPIDDSTKLLFNHNTG